jgi:hypothetical protein
MDAARRERGMDADALNPALFIGSSTEGRPVAQALQAELDYCCQPSIWSQGIFEPGATNLSALLEAALNSDFAALVLTSDDDVIRRGEVASVPRDNVVFELGLFLGALGPQRVFILRPRNNPLRLPTDLAGVTVLEYRADRTDGNIQAAVGPAATAISNKVTAVGLRKDRELPRSDTAPISASAHRRGLDPTEEAKELDRELDAIVVAAEAQGWVIKTRSTTAFRLVTKNGNRYSFPLGSPAETRDRLRPFAQQLKTAGLRVSSVVLRPVNEGP